MGRLEHLEKTLIAKWKAKTTILTSPSEVEMKSAIHSAYLETLEEEAISKHPSLFFLDSNGNKKYCRYRTIVLSTVALLESKLDHLLQIQIDRDYTRFFDSKKREAVQEIIGSLEFNKKIRCVDLFYKTRMNVKLLYCIANIRNAFAHTLPLSSKKYYVDKKNVVINIYAFSVVIEKAFEEIDLLQKLIEEQPEHQAFEKILDARLKALRNSRKS